MKIEYFWIGGSVYFIMRSFFDANALGFAGWIVALIFICMYINKVKEEKND